MDASYKKFGEIMLDEIGLFPCIWIGFIDNAYSVIPWRESEKNVTWNEIGNGVIIPKWDGVVPPYSLELKPGQFIIDHQYKGTACSHITLAGIFLPLSTCENDIIREELEKLIKKYFNGPFKSWEPNLNELMEIGNDLKLIGPLHNNYHFKKTAEAFIEFGLSEIAYSWIRQYFSFVSEIEEIFQTDQIKITKTEKLPLENLNDFVKWMGGPAEKNPLPNCLKAAILYENSD
ncbi:MAG TPA: hypothetical protein VF941_02290 [Clostridia bacterium]